MWETALSHCLAFEFPLPYGFRCVFLSGFEFRCVFLLEYLTKFQRLLNL